MAEPFLGEVRMVGFNFAPVGWAFCNGQALSIAQNPALFSLLGTTYGGDGQTTFNLPNLQGRIPIHQGNSFVQGQLAGSETVTLTSNQVPSHTHTAQCQTGDGNQQGPGGGWWAGSSLNQYSAAAANGTMNAGAVSPAILGAGGPNPHDNMMPYLVINFIIALEGIFPSRN